MKKPDKNNSIIVQSDFGVVWQSNNKESYGLLMLNISENNPVIAINVQATESFLYGVSFLVPGRSELAKEIIKKVKAPHENKLDELEIKYPNLKDVLKKETWVNGNELLVCCHNDFKNYTGAYKNILNDIMPIYLEMVTKNEQSKKMIIDSISSFFDTFRGSIREKSKEDKATVFGKICEQIDLDKRKFEGANNSVGDVVDTLIQLKSTPKNPFHFINFGRN